MIATRREPGTGAPARQPAGLHRYALLVCASTFVLIFAGGLVTSTGSGLAVPDWPLSFGQVFPAMEGGVLFEHGHRLVAASMGLLTIGLYIWAWLGGASKPVKLLAACALGAVILQGLLGGLTVLMKLPPAVSIAHACLAQLFLCATVAVAAVTGAGWDRPGLKAEGGSMPLRALALATTAAVFGQLVLGAVMRHTHAGLAIPDFPLAFGRILPPLDTEAVQIHFAHRAWAVVVAGLAVWLSARVFRSHGAEPRLARPAIALLVLLAAQISLGGLTVLTRRAVAPTTLHVLVGAMILAASFLITLRAHRLSRAGAAASERAAGRRPLAAPA